MKNLKSPLFVIVGLLFSVQLFGQQITSANNQLKTWQDTLSYLKSKLNRCDTVMAGIAMKADTVAVIEKLTDSTPVKKIFKVAGTRTVESFYVGVTTKTKPDLKKLKTGQWAMNFGTDEWVTFQTESYPIRHMADSISRTIKGSIVIPVLNDTCITGQTEMYRIRLCMTTAKPRRLPNNVMAIQINDKWYWYSKKYFRSAPEAEMDIESLYIKTFYDAYVVDFFVGSDKDLGTR